MNFQTFLYENKIEYVEDIKIFEWLDEHLQDVKTVLSNKKVRYFNCPAAFDIEVSSFEDNGEKRACMYLWAFGFNGGVIYGRTWEQLTGLFAGIADTLGLNENRHLIVYVHNLAYEFQFIRKRFEWENVFSLRDRKPVKAITKNGIEFRCSYLLTGYNLEHLGKQLRKYKTEKAVGDLDYSKVRHSKTPITEKELFYQAQDVRVVMAYIKECIEKEQTVANIPLTKTSYVRRYCRNNCLYIKGEHHKRNRSYKQIMDTLTLTPEQYEMLKRAFAGGFTHANAFYSCKTIRGVSSFDFTSSYPAVMVAKKFPMSKPEERKIESADELQKYLSNYCCLFDVEFCGIYPRLFFDHPISVSKCFVKENVQTDNGRVVSADRIQTTITEQDFAIIRDFYEWQNIRIGKFYTMQKGYLPTPFIKSILDLYHDKTTLKGVEGKEAEYMNSKEMLNSCYGMCVTDIVRDEIIYNGEWGIEAANVEKSIERYNKSKTRFLFYPWGVWVTAHARRALFSGIKAFGDDYIYSDTDSIKARNAEAHEDYISTYNEQITKELQAACLYHNLPVEACSPETIKGIKKPLGVWDYEGKYDLFKTLGAKRYLTAKNGDLTLTISGVNKKDGANYLRSVYGELETIFAAFDDGLYFPAGKTGKNTHSYIDEETRGTVTDYRGETAEYHELSSVNLSPADYSLSIYKLYLDYLKGFRYE